MNYRYFGVSLFTLVALDTVWLGFVMTPFYTARMGEIARMMGGRMDPVFAAAAAVYVCLALALTVLVRSRSDVKSWLAALKYGAVFGATSYGLYDFTNMATLKTWPLSLVLVDIAWGTFSCGLASAVAYRFSSSTINSAR
jgi:uncharacterized membrane protein